MLVEQMLDEGIDASTLTLPEAEGLYKRASSHFKRTTTSPTAPGSGWSSCSPVTTRPGRSGAT